MRESDEETEGKGEQSVWHSLEVMPIIIRHCGSKSVTHMKEYRCIAERAYEHHCHIFSIFTFEILKSEFPFDCRISYSMVRCDCLLECER